MLLAEYHEELEFDLLTRCGGVDLLDFYRGTLSARRLWVLIRRLPPDSAFFRAAYPDDAYVQSWGPLEHLVASIWDLQMAVAMRGQKGPDRPTYPRPGDQLRRRSREAALEAQAERNRLRAGDVTR